MVIYINHGEKQQRAYRLSIRHLEMEGNMGIGNIKEFQQSQMTKVARRKEEEKQIKKGIYQTKMMIQSQTTEIFDKEREKSRERTELSREEAGQAKTKEQARRKTDVHTEMKKMLSTAPRNIAMKI
ncbi:MAG: hypothetical protein K2P25_01335 [Lachnospiraceae bacterium]|nr:hypothetical protein [Lachnospiraceae bacterium]